MATFSIAGIIQSIDKQLYCYDTTFRTYQEALVHDDCTLNLIVVLKGELDSGRTTYKYIDMPPLLEDYLSSNGEMVEYEVRNWDDLATFLTKLYNTDITIFNKYLTYSAAPRYQHYKYNGYTRTRLTPFSTNMKKTIDIVSLGYTTDLTASYVNKDAPDIRDLPHRRLSLPDLVFSKTSDDVSFDLSNTLVSVDGIICYPIYSKSRDELFACNGARFLRHTTDSNSLNILLMDFSNLGTLHHYKLSDCKQELVIKSGNKVWVYNDANRISDVVLDSSVQYWHQAEYSMKFKLPIGAVNGYPILSLAGRMFLPGIDDLRTYTSGGYIVVEFHISNAVLENIIASNLQHQNLFFKNSNMFRTTLSYAFCNIFIDQAYQYDEGTSEWLAIQFYMDQVIPFITIVESDTDYAIDRIPGICTGIYGKIIFPPKCKGLLVNKDTREFIDYTRIPYKSQTLVTFTPQNSLFIQTREGTNTNNDLLISEGTTYEDMIEFAPNELSLNIDYNTREHRYKIHHLVNKQSYYGLKSYVTTYSQSNTLPYEISSSTKTAKEYQWSDDFGTAKYDEISTTWYVLDDNDLVIWESESEGVRTHTETLYKDLIWYKVLDYTDSKVIWYLLADGTQTVSDGTRTDRMAWSISPNLFIDQYNKFELGEYIKDPQHYEILDICIKGETGSSDLLDDEDNPAKQADPNDDTSTPMIPLLTAEYERVKSDISIGQNMYIVTSGTTAGAHAGDIDLNGNFKLDSVKDGYSAVWMLSKTYYDTSRSSNTTAIFRMSFVNSKEDYTLTEDTVFESGKTYYIKSGTVYTKADVTVGATVPANTYYECNIGYGYWIIKGSYLYNGSSTEADTWNIAYSNNGVAPSSKNTKDPANAGDWKLIEGTGDVAFGGTLVVNSVNSKYVTNIKVEPVFDGEVISTSFIKVKNATNVGPSYSNYDGLYKLTVAGATGTERIWENQKIANIVIKYVPVSETCTVPHWGIFNDNVEVFATDLADEGSAPYTSILVWRLI